LQSLCLFYNLSRCILLFFLYISSLLLLFFRVSCFNGPVLKTVLQLEGCLTLHLPNEIKWNANLMHVGNFIDVFLDRHVSCSRTAPFAPYTRPTQRLSRPPPIQKLGAENHTLQLNI
jgi:hypothetical protein